MNNNEDRILFNRKGGITHVYECTSNSTSDAYKMWSKHMDIYDKGHWEYTITKVCSKGKLNKTEYFTKINVLCKGTIGGQTEI